MAQDNAERFPIGRTALGGAACGFTYDGALLDAVAREERLRRPLRLGKQWPGVPRPTTAVAAARQELEEARSDATA